MAAPANPEIDLAFVSCSCRACERAGEAKLRGRDVCPPNAGPKVRKKNAPPCTFFEDFDTCFTVEMFVF